MGRSELFALEQAAKRGGDAAEICFKLGMF
jgi:TPR repeat protein